MMESVLLLISAAAVHLSLSPPNPPVDSCECYVEKEGERSFFEIFVQSVTWCSKVGLSFRSQNPEAHQSKPDDDVDRLTLQPF